jgi:S1-C subfamily serine protease
MPAMESRSSSFRSVFIAAVLGGLLVAALGLAAVSAGWVGKTESTTRTVAAAAPVASESDPNLVNQIYERDGAGVGFITASGVPTNSAGTDPFGQGGTGTATGSGFLIDKDGDIVTNNHVVEGAQKITVKLGDSDTSYDATVVGTDASTDLALLNIDAPEDELTPLEVGDSDKLEVGDPVVAIGNPFGLNSTVTTGIVSALQREIQSTNGYSISEVIQTDAAINPGNSGGPLINTEGQVVGVNSQIATGGSGSGNVGIGFAVPASTVKDVVGQIKDGGKVEHAYLGVSGATIDPEIADALNLGVDSGVLVQEVTSGGPSDDAGIKGGDTPVTVGSNQVLAGGDVITAIDGKTVSTMDEVVTAINEAEVGDVIKVTVDRDGESKDFDVELGLRPENVSGSGQDSQQQLPPGFGN